MVAVSDSRVKGRKEEELFIHCICGGGVADLSSADAVFLLSLVDHHEFCHQ